MKFLIIGLGSMGKRRIRCLKELGINDLFGFDLREDRINESEKKYGIKCFNDYETALKDVSPNALIISVPPDKHHIYVKSAIKKSIHFFVEASVVDVGIKEAIKELKNKKIVAAPSATLYFHPAIHIISEIVKSGELGIISNVLLHSGQYLPDWHTYEPVSDYYVSNKATGGGREIVPFELSWFTRIFGMPDKIAGNFRKTIDIKGAEKIDDTYNILLDYKAFLAVVTVDVVSRFATRRLLINGSEKQLCWSWDENRVKIYDPIKEKWDIRNYEMKDAENGYNNNIGENMYIDEIRNFIDAINGTDNFFNTLEKDLNILKLLYKAEQSDNESVFIKV